MIGKVKIGSSFQGVVRYVMQKPEAQIIRADGVRTQNIHSTIDDFNTQRKMNPELSRAVGHIALSWSEKDAGKLSAEIMTQRTQEYMHKMKITDTQYLLVLHKDKNHPHVHLIYNRVNNQGKTISDRFQNHRNHKVCKEITLQYGYHLGKGKSQVNRQQLTGADKIRYELYDAIKAASLNAQSWNSLAGRLEKQGIQTNFKCKASTNEVQGISFVKDGLQFKGSKIDRSMSFGRLDALIRQNQTQSMTQHFRKDQAYHADYSKEGFQYATFSQTKPTDPATDVLFSPVKQPDPETINQAIKKPKKYLGHSL